VLTPQRVFLPDRAVVLPDRHNARITESVAEKAWEVLLERLRSFSEAEVSDVQLCVSSTTLLSARVMAPAVNDLERHKRGSQRRGV
jgi:hypothetical protein